MDEQDWSEDEEVDLENMFDYFTQSEDEVEIEQCVCMFGCNDCLMLER